MGDADFVYENRTDDLDVPLTVEGALPPSLTGTLYGMGACGTRVGDTPLALIDAHGRIVAARLEGGAGRLRARMVDTPLWQAERDARAIAKRRVFTNRPSRWANLFDLDLANPASHNVARWGADLVAMNDPGFFRLDPDTLATRGPAPLVAKKGASLCPMARRDPATGRHVVFEVRPGLRDTMIVREVADDFTVATERTYKLDRGAAFFHDVAFTEHYYVVIQWAAVSPLAMLWGAAPVIQAMRFDPATTPRLLLLPRAGGAPIAVPLPGGRVHFHMWNAYEAGGQVIVDAVGYAGKVDLSGFAPPALIPTPTPTPPSASWRYTIDPAARTARDAQLGDLVTEGPAINEAYRGRPYRFGWAATPGTAGPGPHRDPHGFFWFHAMTRFDHEARTAQTWDAGPDTCVSFPAFVPRPGATAEDDGHLVAFLQRPAAGTSAVAVFDAREVAAGPVATLHAPGLLGAIIHVAYA